MDGYMVEFKFKPKDRVVDPLGVEGIVTMVGVAMESPDPQYYVKTATGSQWWLADQLEKKGN